MMSNEQTHQGNGRRQYSKDQRFYSHRKCLFMGKCCIYNEEVNSFKNIQEAWYQTNVNLVYLLYLVNLKFTGLGCTEHLRVKTV